MKTLTNFVSIVRNLISYINNFEFCDKGLKNKYDITHYLMFLITLFIRPNIRRQPKTSRQTKSINKQNYYAVYFAVTMSII